MILVILRLRARMIAKGQKKTKQGTPDPVMERKRSSRRALLAAASLPPLLALALWMPVINYGFLWDDWLMLNRQLPALTVGTAFAPPTGLFGWTYNYYRPLTAMSLLVDGTIYGTNSKGFHATVLVLHAAASLAIFLLARRFMKLSTALLAASLFAVFPLNVDSVAWVSGRTDPLAVLFSAGAAALYLKAFIIPGTADSSKRLEAATGVRSRWALAGAGLLIFAALLSKETALALIPILIAIAWFQEDRGRQFTLAAAVALAPVLLYAGLRLALNPGPAPDPEVPMLSQPLEAFQTVAWLSRRLVFPYPETLYLSKAPGSIVSVLVLILGSGAGLFLFANAIRKRRFERLVPLLWIGSSFAVIASSALWLGRYFPIVDRHLYFPAAGWSMLIAALLAGSNGASKRSDAITSSDARPGFRYRPLLGLIMGWILVALFCVISVGRLSPYASDLDFWTTATMSEPSSGIPWINLGNARGERKDYPGAEEAYRKALTLQIKDSERARAMSGLGMALVSDHKAAEGNEMLKQAAYYRGAGANEKFNYALFLFIFKGQDASSSTGLKDLEETSLLLEQAVREDPFFARAWLLLGQNETRLARFDRARIALSRAASLDRSGGEIRRKAEAALATLNQQR